MKKAFTLAETLITLGVIGVVAALTLPTLINSYKKQVTTARLKKFNSIFNDTRMHVQMIIRFTVQDCLNWMIGNLKKTIQNLRSCKIRWINTLRLNY